MHRTLILSALGLVALASCTLIAEPQPRTPPPLTEPGVSRDPTPVAPRPTQASTSPLSAQTAPFLNMTDVIDDICFDYLDSLGDTTFVWWDDQDIRAFFERANASGLCPRIAAPPAVDFSTQVIAGAISQATGCDAAHRVISFTSDTAAHTYELILQLDVRSGCDYELIEPVIVALPRPPANTTITISVTAS